MTCMNLENARSEKLFASHGLGGPTTYFIFFVSANIIALTDQSNYIMLHVHWSYTNLVGVDGGGTVSLL